MTFEEYCKTKEYEVHTEIINLVKEKVNTANADQVDHVKAQFRHLIEQQKYLLDTLTLTGLNAILENKPFNEKEAYENQRDVIPGFEQEYIQSPQKKKEYYYPERSDVDTSLLPPMEENEYVAHNMETEQIQENLDEQFNDTPKDPAGYSDLSKSYDNLIVSLRQISRSSMVPQVENKDFKIDRVTEDTDYAAEQYQIEKLEEKKEHFTFYEPTDEMDNPDYVDSILQKRGEPLLPDAPNYEKYIDKLQKELFYAEKDLLKSNYEQARNTMKLNSLLRHRLAQQVKSMRQIF